MTNSVTVKNAISSFMIKVGFIIILIESMKKFENSGSVPTNKMYQHFILIN